LNVEHHNHKIELRKTISYKVILIYLLELLEKYSDFDGKNEILWGKSQIFAVSF
jgi:hypothetical protein